MHSLFNMAIFCTIIIIGISQCISEGCHISGWVHERRNSTAFAMELCLSCINPSIWGLFCEFKFWSLFYIVRDHFVNAPSKWETSHCNIVPHWLGAYTKWSLHSHCNVIHNIVILDHVIEIWLQSSHYYISVLNAVRYQWFMCQDIRIKWLMLHGPLTRYAKLRVRMRRECRERFPRHRR